MANKTRTVTTTFEYDKNGKVTKETRTEYEYEWEPSPVYQVPTWQPSSPGWWLNPVICGGGVTTDTGQVWTTNHAVLTATAN